MIFDFISGEASTQEGGEKFAKWLAEDADLTQKEKKSVIEKIKDFFTKLLDAVRSVIEGQGTLNTTARAGQKAAQQVPVLDDFFNALDNAIDNRQRMLEGKHGGEAENSQSEIRHSIEITEDGEPCVVIDNDVLAGVPKSRWATKIKNILSEYKSGVDLWGGVVKVNAISKNEFLNSKYSQYLKAKEKTAYKDKLLSAQNLDEILKSGKNKKIEDLKHSRNDSFKQFAHSDVLLKVGENGYTADVIIGITTQNAMVFYDIVDMRKADVKIKNATPQGYANSRKPFKQGIASDNKVTQNGPDVNTHSMQNGQKNAQNGKNDSRHSLEVDSQGNELTEAQQRRYKHVAPELRDEDGKIKPFYHGTARADRVGYVFDPKRATSGPMAYFTDDPDIATNYSRDKADTSLAYDSDYDSYETQFQVNGKPVTEYWNTLTAAEKKAMTEKIKQVTLDDNDNIVLKPGNQIGIGSFSDYELHRAKGNALSVLVDMWLGDGNLWNEESRFLDVLKAVGIDQAQYNDPDYREEKVYQAYLNITNPYNTGKLDQSFIDDLQSYVDDADMSRYDTDNAQADMWDKNGIPIEDWLERLQDDLDNGTTHAWTTVPDVVTDFLKDSGYDGIVDQGGKNGGDQHTVAIPFYSNQIKEVTNGNPTDSPDIRYSKSFEYDSYGGENLKDTPVHLRPRGNREWSAFNRSFANKTAGMEAGENRSIVIFTADYCYQVEADGYMTGTVISKDKITNEGEVTELYEKSSIEGYSDRHDANIETNGNGEGGHNRRWNTDENRKASERNDGLAERSELQGNRIGRNRQGSEDRASREILTDSRKSKSIDDTGRTSLLRDDKRLEEMNITLRQVFDSQELETGHHTSQTQVQRVARQLKKSTGSKMDTPRLMVQLKGLFDYIGNNDDVTFSSVMDQAKEIAHELLDSTPEHTVRDEYAQEVLDTLRGMAITLSDEQKAETAYHHDRYGNDLLFLYFASKSTAISAVMPKVFCFLLLFV